MKIRSAKAQWKGTIKKGNGTLSLGSGAFEGKYSFGSRFEDAGGTNPEELIGAAHAGCFSMALSKALTDGRFDVQEIATDAKVHLDKAGEGFAITRIDLTTVADVPDIGDEEFLSIAKDARDNCPVSKALAGVEITLEATLRSRT